MPTENLCPLCDKEAVVNSLNLFGASIECIRCGTYLVEDNAIFPSLVKDSQYINDRHLISGRTRTHFETKGKPLLLRKDDLESIINGAPKTFVDKRMVLLKYLAILIKTPGRSIKIDVETFYPLAYCKDQKELNSYLGRLNELEFINDMNPLRSPRKIFLNGKGWEEIGRLQVAQISSNKVFVAMNFDDKFDEIYENGLYPAITDAGYDCFRMKEVEHNEKICEKILYEIKQSKFLVADVMEKRSGVYFEAGYAMALEKEVIWCCRKDREEEDVHFDSRQYNHIFWKDLKDLKKKLKKRILNTRTIGRGKNEVKPD